MKSDNFELTTSGQASAVDGATMIAELDGTNQIQRIYTYNPQSMEPISTAIGCTAYFYITDHLMTPQMLTSISGTTVWYADLSAFGTANVITSTVSNNLRFPGMYADSETGLYYNMNRYYYSSIGRYIERDPILEPNPIPRPIMYALYNGFALIIGDIYYPQDIYQYVRNTPTNSIDRYGLYIGQLPPPPPGYDPGTWTSGVFGDGTGYVQSPDGTKYVPHPEDNGHWRHWDKQGPGGDNEGSWPPNSGKPWPGQGKLKPKQSPTDPNGNAPEMPWPPVMPFMPLEPMPLGPMPFEPIPVPCFE